MPKFVKKLVSVAIVVGIAFQLVPTTEVKAVISSCGAEVDIHDVVPTSENLFNFTVNNTDSNTVQWVTITRPSGNFTLIGAQVNGWGSSVTAEVATFTLGSIVSGGSHSFGIRASAADVQASSANWVVKVSDDPNGANPFSCAGALGTSISGSAPDTTPPTISNISMSGLTSNSITISWMTDELATSKIYYGLDDSYGSEKSDLALKTSHTVTLTGLTSDIGYHFQVESVDGSGNSAQSGDNTFLTPVPSQSGFTNNASSSNFSSSESTLKKLKLTSTEKIPPTITIATDFSKPFVTAPTIVGTAADNVGVYSVEYSTDSGKNWLPADKQTGLGGKSVSFEFKPLNLDDGNYKIVARATDTSGNQTLSQTYTLIIDRLPPTVGGSVISIGPQILKPDKDGIVTTVVGIDQKVTVSSVGGATQVSIRAITSTSKTNSDGNVFALSRSNQTGLWSGILSFSKKGLHNLIVEASDGAGNKTKRDFGKIYALSGGQITEKDSKKVVTQAKITLFYLEPDSNSWVVWDGSSYGQQNPQTSKAGQFRLFTPAGKYYLQVAGDGYKTVISKIFEVNQTMPLAKKISLEKATKIGFGAFSFTIPSLTIEKISLQQAPEKVNPTKSIGSLVNKTLPSFNLEKTSGGTINQVQLAGKPTLLSFVSTWSPASQEQFQVLDKLQQNQDLNITPIAVMESSAKIVAYKVISKLKLDYLVDPDGATINSFGYQSLPTHYFVNRKGLIKRIVVGVLSEKEIINGLGGL